VSTESFDDFPPCPKVTQVVKRNVISKSPIILVIVCSFLKYGSVVLQLAMTVSGFAKVAIFTTPPSSHEVKC
jgi:hypothetical protein